MKTVVTCGWCKNKIEFELEKKPKSFTCPHCGTGQQTSSSPISQLHKKHHKTRNYPEDYFENQ